MPRWHAAHNTCTHANDDVCPTCDFDGYYERSYPDCPWRTRPGRCWRCDADTDTNGKCLGGCS